jgi:hypothetical protein
MRKTFAALFTTILVHAEAPAIQTQSPAHAMIRPLNMGMGDKLDRSKTQALHAGSIAVIDPKTNHFSWTKVETVVQFHGIGPLVIHYVNPADDPRNK